MTCFCVALGTSDNGMLPFEQVFSFQMCLASLTWWCQGLPFTVGLFTFMLLCVYLFNCSDWFMLQPDIWNNLCWNANLLLEVSPGNPSLPGVPFFCPQGGKRAWEQGRRPCQCSHPDLTASAGGLRVTTALSVLKATPRGWHFWLPLFDFYFLMRLFEVNTWIKCLVLCEGRN